MMNDENDTKPTDAPSEENEKFYISRLLAELSNKHGPMAAAIARLAFMTSVIAQEMILPDRHPMQQVIFYTQYTSMMEGSIQELAAAANLNRDQMLGVQDFIKKATAYYSRKSAEAHAEAARGTPSDEEVLEQHENKQAVAAASEKEKPSDPNVLNLVKYSSPKEYDEALKKNARDGKIPVDFLFGPSPVQ